MQTQETKKEINLKEVVDLLKQKGFNSVGLFYGKGGPTGIKMGKNDVEKLCEILTNK
jgi:hypothetical protein